MSAPKRSWSAIPGKGTASASRSTSSTGRIAASVGTKNTSSLKSRVRSLKKSTEFSSNFRLRTSDFQSSELFDSVAFSFEHGEQAVGSDEVGSADDDQRVPAAAEQGVELGHPVLVPFDEQTLVELRLLLQVLEDDALERRAVARAPRFDHP